MKTLYLDCFAGISGDMFLGALMDLGLSSETLAGSLSCLALDGFTLSASKVTKNGLGATKADVHLPGGEQRHRHLSDILKLIDDSGLPPAVKARASETFNCLAAAEATVHRVTREKVHFHEVGAIDAIVDIVGTVTALDLLGVEQICCSPLPLGSGFVQCAHGTLPLPAPAVLEILKGVPTVSSSIAGETVTPTGAALAKTLSSSFGPFPAMTIDSVGYGAGTADRSVPNVLRAVLGDTVQEMKPAGALAGFTQDCLITVEANIDDMNPEFYDHIVPALFSAGAVDVFLAPVIMKKGRPAQVLTSLVHEEGLPGIISLLLSETTTLGVRTYSCGRYKLARESVTVDTPYGAISVKVGRLPSSGKVLNIAPEWEDCKALASKSGVPVKTVYDLAKAEAYKLLNHEVI